MANTVPLGKRQQIEQATSTMVLFASAALFVTVFSILCSHALWTKLSFQDRVISAKTTAQNQLNKDITASQQLQSSYQKFNGESTNLLGGSVSGVDNDNAKIVLDSLPSSYDFPALTNSISALLSNQGVTIGSISGTDESATLAGPSTTSPTTATSTTSTTGGAVAMPFSFSVNGPYSNLQNVISTFEKSIRPFQIQTVTLSGSQANVSMTVTAQTFYQPATKFTITTETVK